ncbi:hypothetical protein PSHT_00006 [Puccinia striiformis]|uniref:E2 ubiquitin-conjugating enzyme n=1 Tax=Puccinia striiformis TaxID=27350 RepID=A0A2S4WP66_9BASI|nr:hypothetical protein PSHT_00006 [Puccinia striiformis]
MDTRNDSQRLWSTDTWTVDVLPGALRTPTLGWLYSDTSPPQTTTTTLHPAEKYSVTLKMADNLSSKSLRRINKELNSLRTSPPEGIRVLINEDDITDVKAWIHGPAETPYHNGYFKISIRFGPEYPSAPPTCIFTTKIFHPNVGPKGEICVNTLKKDWNSTQTLMDILTVIKCLLIYPNPESALDEEAGRLLLENYDEYFTRAKLWTDIHAKNKPPSGLFDSVDLQDLNLPLVFLRPHPFLSYIDSTSAETITYQFEWNNTTNNNNDRLEALNDPTVCEFSTSKQQQPDPSTNPKPPTVLIKHDIRGSGSVVEEDDNNRLKSILSDPLRMIYLQLQLLFRSMVKIYPTSLINQNNPKINSIPSIPINNSNVKDKDRRGRKRFSKIPFFSFLSFLN